MKSSPSRLTNASNRPKVNSSPNVVPSITRVTSRPSSFSAVKSLARMPQSSKQAVSAIPPYSLGLFGPPISGVSTPNIRTLSLRPSPASTSKVSPSMTLVTVTSIFLGIPRIVMIGILVETSGMPVGSGVPAGSGVPDGIDVPVRSVVAPVLGAVGDEFGAWGTVVEAPSLHPPAKPASIKTPRAPVYLVWDLSAWLSAALRHRVPKQRSKNIAQHAPCCKWAAAGGPIPGSNRRYGKLILFKTMIDAVGVSTNCWTSIGQSRLNKGLKIV